MRLLCFLAALVTGLPQSVVAEEPYFVTYSHHLEEQGNLEIGMRSAVGRPPGSNIFLGSAVEFEYGLLGWWTTELYLDGQATRGQGSLFTGSRWENRFRVTRREHWINPVLYLEFENINGADKALLEVVGHDGKADLSESNSIARKGKKRELETKLLLGSNWHGWNFSENFIAEKNVIHAPWEFGYAVGASRPVALRAKPNVCNLCAENFSLGLEAYGGLGNTWALNLKDTSHYVAPALEWRLANGLDLKISPSFGLTASSFPILFRIGVSYEISQFAKGLRK